MNVEELKEAIAKKKLDAWDRLKLIVRRDIPPQMAGYRDVGHAAELIVLEAEKEVEKMLQAWEKENP